MIRAAHACPRASLDNCCRCALRHPATVLAVVPTLPAIRSLVGGWLLAFADTAVIAAIRKSVGKSYIDLSTPRAKLENRLILLTF